MTEVEMPSARAIFDSSGDASSPTNPLKRRHSANEDGQTRDPSGAQKRQRANGDASPIPNEPPSSVNTVANQNGPADGVTDEAHDTPQTTEDASHTQEPPPPAPTRRKPNTADEKQRSKRLFGALLGNLARPSDNKQSTRRAEIEARRKSEIRKQDEEVAAREERAREERLEWRQKRQGDVEEDQMKIRHCNELERAKFFVTNAEPRIYWRPWELREGEEERVEAQIRAVEDRVAREREDFFERTGRNDDGEGGRKRDGMVESAAADGEFETSNKADNTASKRISTDADTQQDGGDDVPRNRSSAIGLDNVTERKPTHEPASEGDLPVEFDSNMGIDSGLAVKESEDGTRHESDPEPELEHDGGGDGEEDTVIY